MGSIQGLRSEALALRAKEDTALQISSHLAGVNKSLGTQVTNLIDGLQGVIAERTKAYNQMVGKLNQSINGKGGVGDQGVKWAFQVVNVLVQATGVVQGLPTSSTNAGPIIASATSMAAQILQTVAINATLSGAYYDYEKAASQLGMNADDRPNTATPGNPRGYKHSGAVELVRIRDAIMPRYKALDQNWGGWAGASPATNNRGYIGTLRRL